MDRLTYRDDEGRARLTEYGRQMYCSTQATADCFAELEEIVERTMPKWISVKERLPEDRHSVLVYCPYNKCIYTAYYEDFNDEWYYFGCGGRIEVYYTVSHWMPLPESPKEVNDGN